MNSLNQRNIMTKKSRISTQDFYEILVTLFHESENKNKVLARQIKFYGGDLCIDSHKELTKKWNDS